LTEIVSENDRADDLIPKATQYPTAGTRAIWLLCPNANCIFDNP